MSVGRRVLGGRWAAGRSGRRSAKGEWGCRSVRRRLAFAPVLASLVIGSTVIPAAAQSGPRPATVRPAPQAASVSFPATPAGRQAEWFAGAVAHHPIPMTEIDAHFDSTFLSAISPATLNGDLTGVAGVQLDSISTSTPTAIAFIVTVNGTTRLTVSLSVDAHGLINGLRLQPASSPSVPSTWAEVDSMVRSVAPQVHMLVASLSGNSCQPVNEISATTPAPLGSAFKLYVLDALAQAIAAGKASWAQKLTVTSQLKSLPSGVLQDDPAGTQVSVQQAAEDMISISDNTAANLLMGLVGRAAVEAATVSSGMADPALDVPFLNTRELFVLKLDYWPKLAQHYLSLAPAAREAYLTNTVDQLPLSSSAAAWTTPRDIGTLEWFASPLDICHVYASLSALAKEPKLGPVSTVLALNSGDLDLAPGQWRSVWFKGGSEPGVLTLNYLASTTTGKTYVVSVMAENTSAAISETSAELTLISAIEGAFSLAAG